MSWARTVVRALVAGSLACAAGGPVAAAGSGQASAWIDLGNARVRLTGGASAAKVPGSHLAGIELTLAEGWKTYWRMPGDAGVPPSFDWSASSNVASIKVLYPAPQRLPEPGAETVGYKKAVTFPIEVVAKDAAKPVRLALSMELGICRDICIPAEAKIALELAPNAQADAPLPALLAALDSVPRRTEARRASDPRVAAATAVLDGPAPRLVIDVVFPRGSETADAFIEAPEGLYVPMLRRMPRAAGGAALTADANDAHVRFEADLGRASNARDLKGKTLTLTLVSAAGASETTWTLP